MLSGDNTILQKATDAKQTSERAEAKEQAQMDIMAYIADKTAKHQYTSLDDTKVKEILSDNKSYVKTANDSSFITAKGEHTILYSELYDSSKTNNITVKDINSKIGTAVTGYSAKGATWRVFYAVEILNHDDTIQDMSKTTQSYYTIIEGEYQEKEKSKYSLSIQFVKVPYDINKELEMAKNNKVPQIEDYIKELSTAKYRKDTISQNKSFEYTPPKLKNKI